MSETFPWTQLLHLGLGVLRWSPRDFWAATPRELAGALGKTEAAAMPRTALDRLMQLFPDQP